MHINKEDAVTNNRDTVVVVDKDGTFTDVKGGPFPETEEAARRFLKTGGKLFLATGAPLAQVFEQVPRWPDCFTGVYAESGGVCAYPDGRVQVFGSAERVNEVKGLLGIGVSNGLAFIPGIGDVIVEGGEGVGKRRATLTLLHGDPPHFPGVRTTVDPVLLLEAVKQAVRLVGGLKIIADRNHIFGWVDVMSRGKEDVVGDLLVEFQPAKLYFIGDGPNDEEAMRHPRVIPVGCANSTVSIQDEARRRGIFIPQVAYKGGVAKFLNAL